MPEIPVEELARWRASDKEFVLLDVREPHEVAAAALPGALCIPMRQIPARTAEIPRGVDVAVLCHYGTRSDRVAHFLELQGFENVYNVEGGIDDYALRVDPSIPRY